MDAWWRIELLGGVRVTLAERVITPFRRHRVEALFAYLAFYGHRSHPREELIELLWPEADPELGRNNLRVNLHLLRLQLEEPGSPAEGLLLAQRDTIQLRPNAFTTDVAEFEAALQAAARVADAAERARLLATAVALYQGELLPGFFESWVLTERLRLAEAYQQALQQLVGALERAGDLEGAVSYARRAVSADPLREEAHYDLIRLYAAAGQPTAALRQYQELERLLREELEETPSAAARALAEELRESARTIVVGRSAPANAAPAPVSVPAPRSAASSPETVTPSAGRLPVQFTRFFGREEEIARLTEMLSVPETRLVTLTGPGGSGKTRLAIAVAGRFAAELAGEAPSTQGALRVGGGPWFVPLAEMKEAQRLGDAIRDAMGLLPSPDREPLEQVVAVLSSREPGTRPSLLVLDNFEQLVEEGAPLVRTLLERVPSLTCLVTSRRRLELEGELECPVLPLPTPVARRQSPVASKRQEGTAGLETRPPSPDALLQFPSVALFVDRARAARPGFQLTAENAGAVAALCDRLEGLPLAIELAAARAGVLTPQQMLSRLAGANEPGAPAVGGARFELLVSPRRDVSARHRTLRAAMEWSYRLLAPELQHFLAQLSVFRSGWTLEAAEAVTGREAGDGCGEPRALEYLEALRACSLVVAEPAGLEMRYRLLETVREFAAEQLTSDEYAALEHRHFRYFFAFAESREGFPDTEEHWKNWLAWHEAEYDNVRAALEWGLTAAPAEALRLVDWLTKFWYIRGYVGEALEFIRRAVQWRSEETTEQRARALRYAGEFANFQGEYEQAQRFLEEALALGRAIDSPGLIAGALNNLGEVAAEQGEYDRARMLYQESLEIHGTLGDGAGITWPLAGLAEVARALGEYEAARAYAEQSLAIYRRWGDRRHAAQLLRDLGFVACCQGEYERAQQLFNESLSIFREYGDQADISLSLKGLGEVALARQDFAAARACYQECLTILRDLGGRKSIAAALEGFARLAEAEGQSERAARLLGTTAAIRKSLGSPLPPGERAQYDQCVTTARADMGEAAFATAWAEGEAMTLEQALEYALARAEPPS
jgi:predicted ATPase/DNA-binding SARP family transcriptional activator/Tfp pilus assembly protein PilF